LGPFPLWRGEEPLLESLLPIYEAAARLGETIRRGEPSFGEPAEAEPREDVSAGVASPESPPPLPAGVPRKRGRPRKNP
jgi:hypothetical protein